MDHGLRVWFSKRCFVYVRADISDDELPFDMRWLMSQYPFDEAHKAEVRFWAKSKMDRNIDWDAWAINMSRFRWNIVTELKLARANMAITQIELGAPWIVPEHRYTKTLLTSVKKMGKRRIFNSYKIAQAKQ